MKDIGEFCILVPTRNRRREIESLLFSIQLSSLKPIQVIIVSSGEDISDVVQKFSEILKIKHIHSEISGQINQKKLGITFIDPGARWVAFMDDDLLVFPDTFQTAFECISNFQNFTEKKLVGIGFGLPVTSRFNKVSKITQALAKIFGITNQPPGQVLKNGHATSYLEQTSLLETNWLNGASMWRIEETLSYGAHEISSKYAACEDLIFSYPLGKRNSLVYCPNAKLDFQVTEKTNFENSAIYIAALYWRYFFILEHEEFSILQFNLTQIGRLIFGIWQNSGNRLKFILEAVPATTNVALDSVKRRNPKGFLKSI